MAYKFNEEDKQVKEFSDRIPFGVHKVQLVLAEAGATEAGKDYIDVHVVTPEGIEDRARVWFVGGAANISFNTLRQIAVHNTEGDDNKQKARNAIDAAADSEALANLITENCMGGELWLTKYYDPSRTYLDPTGNIKRSINTNIYGYEPKLKPELMPEKSGADLFHDAAAKSKGVEVSADGSKEVPFPSAGDAPGSTVPSSDAWSGK